MSEKKPEETTGLDKPGFRLLKPGKTIGIWSRKKDEVMKSGEKKHVQENITKASYVPHSYIRANKLNLKHFETKVFETLPKIEKISLKTSNAMLAVARGKLGTLKEPKKKPATA